MGTKNMQPNAKPRTMRAKATLSHLEELVNFVIVSAEECGVPEHKISDIHLAVDEACTNVMRYAYPPGKEGEIELRCAGERSRFAVEIRDWGKPFDPRSVPPPDLGADLDHRPVGGLGIFLMKKSSDEIRYRREAESNRLTIVKFL